LKQILAVQFVFQYIARS